MTDLDRMLERWEGIIEPRPSFKSDLIDRLIAERKALREERIELRERLNEEHEAAMTWFRIANDYLNELQQMRGEEEYTPEQMERLLVALTEQQEPPTATSSL